VSRTCPSCGAAVSETAKFCRGCGGRVIAAAEAPPAVAVSETTAQACPACGAELVPGARFCHMCAAEAPPPPRPARIDCPGCGKEIDGSDAFCRYCGGTTAEWGPDRAEAVTTAPSEANSGGPDAEPLEREASDEELIPVSAEPAANPGEATDVTTEAVLANEEPLAPAPPAPMSETARTVTEPEANHADPVTAPLWAGTAPFLDDDSVVSTTHELNAGSPRVVHDPPAPATVGEDGDGSAEEDAAAEDEATIASSDLGNGAPAAPPERRCGACQAPMSVTARFCRSCGADMTEFEATAVMAPTPGVACASCGREIEGWAQFCRHCGARGTTEGGDGASKAADGSCEVCGAPAARDASLCSDCAQAVGA